MLWMQSYLFYCSVRLGVIVMAFLTLLQLLVPVVLIMVCGLEVMDPLVDLFRNDDYYKNHALTKKFLDLIDDEPEKFTVMINVLMFSQMFTCLVAMYGAFKLIKYLLLPLIFMEFARVIICLTGHIILMIVLKKLINLGVLVAFTLLGGFLILYLAYNWCACVALYQIINLIRCKRYRSLYGDDPFSPNLINSDQLMKNQYSYNKIENVHVITTPNGSDIDAMKQKNYEAQQQRLLQKQGIIAVLPASNYQHQTSHNMPITTIGDSTRFKQRNKKWWQDTESYDAATAAEAKKSTLTQKQQQNDYSVNYGHWQWSEILATGNKKRNILLGGNYRY